MNAPATATRMVNEMDARRQERFSVDYTPRPVVAQGLRFARTLCPQLQAIRRFLDPGAGAGVFGSVIRQMYGNDVLSIAIEPRSEEEPHLRRHHDVVYVDTFQACAEVTPGSMDFIAGNPKFDIWAELVPWALERRSERGVLMLYGRTYWGHSKEAAERSDIFEKYPPSWTLRVGGRVRHRIGRNAKGKPYGTDCHKYSWWGWDAERPGVVGRRMQIDLPQLLPHELRFTAIPGTEEATQP